MQHLPLVALCMVVKLRASRSKYRQGSSPASNSVSHLFAFASTDRCGNAARHWRSNLDAAGASLPFGFHATISRNTFGERQWHAGMGGFADLSNI
jgi:hypothetical protein